MPTSDTSEKGLETLIVNSLVNESKYVQGNHRDYDRDHGIDLKKLLEFIQATQPRVIKQLVLNEDGIERQKFLNRLQGEITKRGTIDILRKGIKHGPVSIDLFYGSPSSRNPKAAKLFASNIFSVTRQLRYSKDESKRSIDLCIFINGLPIATFELKNRLTKQTVDDAVRQYKRDRDSRELLFKFGRCIVHFAVDDQEVQFCTELKGNDSWFLPFNKGFNDGAGNPPNPKGLKTDYLWKQTLTKMGLTDILENYAQIIEDFNESGRKINRRQIFPRYHQLSVVRKLLADVISSGVGKRYLIQHSAGSGKSNSIAWLAHQLVGLENKNTIIFNSVIVVTDRRVLDKQIKNTVKQFAQVSATVGHARRSGDLRKFLEDGKKIIITTVQKFPYILDDISKERWKRTYAIIIDEAHSSQSGRQAAKMNIVLAEGGNEEDYESTEDVINRLIEAHKMLHNASYFAFTATPKNKTLETFGSPKREGKKVKHHPFHCYTMKQAIQERFILDVLQNYTPVQSYYRLVKKISDDPEFDTKKAEKKLRRYVETNSYAIHQKAQIMVDHFLEQVIAKHKIDGQARAMVVTGGIQQAIEYFNAISAYLHEIKSPFEAIVSFSGEYDYGGRKVTEASLNSFPSKLITKKFQENPYRFLVVAEKFQTGYDEPMLHTMYVDKMLSGIKAVQTLSRLNRARPGKYDTFVLDFFNDANTIQASFADYYRTTILSEETDPNKLHDLKLSLEGYQIYSSMQVDEFVSIYLGGAGREQLDPILDECVAIYNTNLNENQKVSFKSKAKAYLRLYEFLSIILPYCNSSWEKLSIFLNFLTPKLPAPRIDDLSRGILEVVDIDSYRVQAQASIRVILPDANSEIPSVTTQGIRSLPESKLDRLSNILRSFNEHFGNIEWKDADKIRKLISKEIPKKVAADKKYMNAMKNSDKQNARIEHDLALDRVIVEFLPNNAELYKSFNENPAFKNWLRETSFTATYKP